MNLIVPNRHGGGATVDNCQPCCRRCAKLREHLSITEERIAALGLTREQMKLDACS